MALGDYYDIVPKDPLENAQFRIDLTRECMGDPRAAEEVWLMSKRDPLFWFNAFGVTIDPRITSGSKAVPFVTFDRQDDMIAEVVKWAGVGDLFIDKSRGVGATHIICGIALHQWQFEPYTQILLGSRKEALVDKVGNRASLFWKVEFMFRHQPGFLRPVGYDSRKHRTLLRMENPEMESILTGEGTIGNFGRGDRCLWIFLDEFAFFNDQQKNADKMVFSATSETTNSRIIVSTHNGENTLFCKKTRREKGNNVFDFDWQENPLMNAGLYRSSRESKEEPWVLEILDKEHAFPDDYPFILDGRTRSPEYDRREKRSAGRREMAQEYDRDPIASGSPYWDRNTIDQLVETIRDPVWTGDISFGDKGEFLGLRDSPSGELLFWTHLNEHRRVFPGRYVIGIDVSEGTGASNSTAIVMDVYRGEKVAEMVSSVRPSGTWAKMCVALSRLFSSEAGNPAKMIWEGVGPGLNFGRIVFDYCNSPASSLYFEKANYDLSKGDRPGASAHRDRKKERFDALRTAQENGDVGDPSYWSVEETKQYQYDQSSKYPVHPKAADPDDPSGAGMNHGDRVTGFTLCFHIARTVKTRPNKQELTAMYSKEWRDQQRKKRNHGDSDRWSSRAERWSS